MRAHFFLQDIMSKFSDASDKEVLLELEKRVKKRWTEKQVLYKDPDELPSLARKLELFSTFNLYLQKLANCEL